MVRAVLRPILFLYACILILISGFSPALGASEQQKTPRLRVASAANFSAPLKALIEQYKKIESVDIETVFASSGKHYAQIIHGAPYDIFLSADQQKPASLVDLGKANRESRATYATGQLALCCLPKDIPKTQKAVVNYITNRPKARQRIALANSRTAPYGIAALEALSALGIEDRSVLVFMENVSQVASLLQYQHLKFGFVGVWQAEKITENTSNNYWLVPSQAYSPIRQDLVILTRSKNDKVSRDFVAFILSEAGKTIIRQYGYQ